MGQACTSSHAVDVRSSQPPPPPAPKASSLTEGEDEEDYRSSEDEGTDSGAAAAHLDRTVRQWLEAQDFHSLSTTDEEHTLSPGYADVKEPLSPLVPSVPASTPRKSQNFFLYAVTGGRRY